MNTDEIRASIPAKHEGSALAWGRCLCGPPRSRPENLIHRGGSDWQCPDCSSWFVPVEMQNSDAGASIMADLVDELNRTRTAFGNEAARWRRKSQRWCRVAHNQRKRRRYAEEQLAIAMQTIEILSLTIDDRGCGVAQPRSRLRRNGIPEGLDLTALCALAEEAKS